MSGEDLIPGSKRGCHLIVSSYGGRGSGALWVLFYKGIINPIHQGSTIMISLSPKGPTSKHHNIEDQVSVFELWVDPFILQHKGMYRLCPSVFISSLFSSKHVEFDHLYILLVTCHKGLYTKVRKSPSHHLTCSWNLSNNCSEARCLLFSLPYCSAPVRYDFQSGLDHC